MGLAQNHTGSLRYNLRDGFAVNPDLHVGHAALWNDAVQPDDTGFDCFVSGDRVAWLEADLHSKSLRYPLHKLLINAARFVKAAQVFNPEININLFNPVVGEHDGVVLLHE